MAETESVIVEYAMVEEVIDGSTDAGPVEKLTGDVPVENIPLIEDPEAEVTVDAIFD